MVLVLVTDLIASSTALWFSSSFSAARAILACAVKSAPVRVGAMLRKLETVPVSWAQFWAAVVWSSPGGATPCATGAARASEERKAAMMKDFIVK